MYRKVLKEEKNMSELISLFSCRVETKYTQLGTQLLNFDVCLFIRKELTNTRIKFTKTFTILRIFLLFTLFKNMKIVIFNEFYITFL